MKNIFNFKTIEPWPEVNIQEWRDWRWQFRNSLRSRVQFAEHFQITLEEEKGFAGLDKIFRVQSTPYYLSLIDKGVAKDPIRQMVFPHGAELTEGAQQMLDPLGEKQNSNRPTHRLIHRYSDRALFLVTDLCSVYCRYCTRKHFTGSDQVLASKEQLQAAVDYVAARPGIKEILFSGGDPLTLSNEKLEVFLKAFYEIPHVELIRVGTRMPVVAPMRIDQDLVHLFKEYKPVYLMTHFNHPQEITKDAAMALESLVDNGIPVFNQMVLLNGINNHPAIVYALSRRLLWLRVKPYYMFQADPSPGTDALRTPIEQSLQIQKELWGHTSGLAMPNYVVDIPKGGGKAPLVPDFLKERSKNKWSFVGWDGVSADYISPAQVVEPNPETLAPYLEEWRQVQSSRHPNL
ncbi:MAG: KamA family radical SAM protein [Bdellovibrionales bacterium]|nr:KamA family radical SAM protein [Bdellovibrionales bacterium]